MPTVLTKVTSLICRSIWDRLIKCCSHLPNPEGTEYDESERVAGARRAAEDAIQAASDAANLIRKAANAGHWDRKSDLEDLVDALKVRASDAEQALASAIEADAIASVIHNRGSRPGSGSIKTSARLYAVTARLHYELGRFYSLRSTL